MLPPWPAGQLMDTGTHWVVVSGVSVGQVVQVPLVVVHAPNGAPGALHGPVFVV